METVARACPVRSRQATESDGRRRSGSAILRQHNVPLNVIIPMGGLGTNDFTEAGYTVPKPMVPIVGRPMLFWLLDNLELQPSDVVWLGVRRDVDVEFRIEEALRHEYPDLRVEFVFLDFETRGATETLYCILNAMDGGARLRRTIQLDSDTLWFCEARGEARARHLYLTLDASVSRSFGDGERAARSSSPRETVARPRVGHGDSRPTDPARARASSTGSERWGD